MHLPRPLASPAAGFVFVSALLLGSLSALAAEPAEFHDPWRLDPVASPVSQFVELSLDPGAHSYSGSTRIEMELHEATSHFQIHAFEMEITGVTIQGKRKPVTLVATEGEEGLLDLSAPAELGAGPYTLEIEFNNDYDVRATSLYKVSTEGEDYLFTQFEATDARGAFPCFDEPEYKIPWQLALNVPAGDSALSNTPVEEVTEEITPDGNFERHLFLQTPPMPSYLVAIAVGPFDFVEVPDATTPCRIVTPKGQAGLAGEAVKAAPPLLAALEEYFGRPYPYRKLDLVAVPEFLAGAMENAGLITFRTTLLLLDPATASIAQKRSLASTIAHEMAHMWYGDLVTMEWWDDLWLNESFATWMGQKITNQVFPEYGIDVNSVRGTEGAKASDTQLATEAIRAPVMSNAVFESMDASITYQKGQSVLGMFENFTGEELFREGVRNYIDANAWGNAVADDLLNQLTASTGLDFRVAMGTFLDQPGVPDLGVTPLGDGKVELTQQRFHYLGQDPPASTPWHIPVILKYSDGREVREHRVILDQPEKIIELPGGIDPEWIYPNADEMGYYRWQVSPTELFDLVDRAATTFTVRERVAMVSQISAQMRAGRISGGDYLRATETLLADPDPEVLNAALRNLGEVRSAFVTPELMPAFRAWVRHNLQPALDQFTLVPREGEDPSVNLLRPALIRWLGNWGEVPEVRTFARDQVDAYLADRESVDGSIIGACISVAAIDGDWKLYNAYRKAFEAATIPAERARFLGGLGQFQNWSMQEAALDYALHGPLRPQELFTIPRGVGTASWDDPSRMWDWFVANYDEIVSMMPPQFKTYMPFFAMGCEEQRLIAAREFFSVEEHQAPGQTKTLARVAEGVSECVDLRRREGPSVSEYLNRQAAD